MAQHHQNQPIVIPMEDDILHTQSHPSSVRMGAGCTAGLSIQQYSLSPAQCDERNVPMTITLPPQAQQQGATALLPTLSTLWVPLDETIGQWAAFAHEAITVSALLATGTAFHGLAWETKALRHYTWAVQERERGRLRKAVHWLERAVQDLDCAIDQWQQVLAWLDLAGNDDQQQDPACLDTIRTLMGQVHEHQARRRALHQQVQQEYIDVKQLRQQEHAAHTNNHEEEGTQR
jgi:hypothetical protein